MRLRCARNCSATSGAPTVPLMVELKRSLVRRGRTRSRRASATQTARTKASARVPWATGRATIRSATQDRPVLVLVVQDPTRAPNHAGKRVFVDVDRQVRLLAEEYVQAANQRTTTGHHYAPVHDIRCELRRRDLQRAAPRVHNLLDRFLDRLTNFRGVHTDGLRDPGDEVTTLDLHLALLTDRKCGADLDLDLLRGRLTDQQVVVLAHELNDRDVQFITTRSDGGVAHDARQGDDRDLGGATADVDHHVAGRRIDRQPDSDGRCHRLGDHEHLLGPGTERAVTHCKLLDFRDPAGNTDDDARLHLEQVILDDERQEVAQHLLGDVEVGDHAVLHRTHRDDCLGCSPEHALGLEADALDLLRFAIDRHHRGLVEHDSLALYIDEGVRGTEIYGDLIGGKERPALEERPA